MTDYNSPFWKAAEASHPELKGARLDAQYPNGFPGSAAYTDPNAKPATPPSALMGGWGSVLPGAKSSGATSNPYPGQSGPPTGARGPFQVNHAAQNAWGEYGPGFFKPTNLDALWKRDAPQLDQPGWSEKIMSSLGPDFFNTPGAGEQFWNSIAGKFSGPAPTTMNNAFSAYQEYMRDKPNLPADAGVGGYYDNAEKHAIDTLNQQFASRGAYGSSVSQGQIGSAVTDMESQRARDEANFQLQRAQVQNAWNAGLANAAQGADRSDILGKEFGLDWTKTGIAGASMAEQQHLARVAMGLEAATAADREKLARLGMGAEIAGATDSGDLSHLLAGMNAALGVEGLSNREVQDAFSNLQTPMNLLFGGAGQTYNDMIGGDAQNFITWLSMKLGIPAEKLMEGYRTQQTGTADIFGAADAVTGAKDKGLI